MKTPSPFLSSFRVLRSASAEGLVDTQMAGPCPEGPGFSRSWVGPGNVHFDKFPGDAPAPGPGATLGAQLL